MALLRHESSGRSRRTIGWILFAWVILLAGHFWLDAELWIVAGLAIFTLPTLRTVLFPCPGSFVMSPDAISWQHGQDTGAIQLADLAFLRLERRWDGSRRTIAVTTDGNEKLLPTEALPDWRRLETALDKAGIPVRRKAFPVL